MGMGIDYDADVREKIRDRGRPITLNGKKLLAIRGAAEFGRSPDDEGGGVWDDRSARYLIIAGDARPAAAPGQLLVDGKSTWRVTDVQDVGDDVQAVLSCTAETGV